MMKFFVAFSLLLAVSAADYRYVGVALNQPLAWRTSAIVTPQLFPISKTQYYYENGLGSLTYGHIDPAPIYRAILYAYGNGNKDGDFSYVKPDGSIYKTQYIADGSYRVIPDNLPVSSSNVESAHILSKRSTYGYSPNPTITPAGHIADTPEVAAAKAAHFAEHDKLKNVHVSSASPTPVALTNWGPSFSQNLSPGIVTKSTSQLYQDSYVNPIVSADGFLKDTPEVAAARAAHFAEKAKVSSQYSPISQYSSIVPALYNSPVSYSAPISYSAPASYFAPASSSYLAQLPYSASKSFYPPYFFFPPSSYSAYASTPAQYSLPNYSGYPQQDYPQFTLSAPSGQVADTPEVAAAKAAHFAEYAAAIARNAATDSEYYNDVPQSKSYYNTPISSGYNGPTPGVPADTPEVAQAKEAHFAKFARVASRQKRSTTSTIMPPSTSTTN